MPSYTFQCEAKNCGHTTTITAPAPKRGRSFNKRRCPNCRRRTLARALLLDARTVVIDQEGSNYAGRFPYISTAFPFKGKGAKHHGTLGKCIIESKQHEDRMRKEHGYVGEKDIKYSHDPNREGQTISRPPSRTFTHDPKHDFSKAISR